MKKITILKTMLLAVILAVSTGSAWGQGLEEFTNLNAPTGTSYGDGSFTGNDGIIWDYTHCLDASGSANYPITGKSLLLRRTSDNSHLASRTISGGIGNFSVKFRKAYTGAATRSLELYIDGVLKGESETIGGATGEDATIYTFSLQDINVEGDFTMLIKLKSSQTGNAQITIDDITWTGYAATPAEPYTVSFNAGTGTYDGGTITETAAGEGVILPSATPCNPEWTFAGWAEASVAEITTTPTLFASGSTYYPTEDNTLFAVYSKTESSSAEPTYELVTTEPADWSGDYLIVNSDDNSIVFDGSLATLDAASNYASAGTNLSGTTIDATWGDTHKFTLAAVTGGYSIQSASGKYIGQATDANALTQSESAMVNTIVFSGGEVLITGAGGAVLRYNATSNQTRFRYYKSTTYTAQKAIQLYKKVESAAPATYDSNPDCLPVINTDLTGTTLDLGVHEPNATEVTETITVSGEYLTDNITLVITGDNPAQFGVDPGTISLTSPSGIAAQKAPAAAIGQTDVDVKYYPTAVEAVHTATLTISSAGATDIVITLKGETKKATNVAEVAENALIVFVEGNNIVVKTAEKAQVALYSVSGKLLSTHSAIDGMLIIPLYTKGAYLVKVGQDVKKVIF